MEQLYDERVSVERLAELIRAQQPCVVLTGAGISTESGIPDFRSPTGIWRQYDPMEYATIDAFLADPGKVWDFYGKRLTAVAAVEPNDGHRALAGLEQRGWVHAIVTQNVDGLHARAGSRNVVEVHGSLRTCSCLGCGTDVPFEQALTGLPLPACPACGSVLKPGVVMFGELLPEAAIGRALRLASEAGLMLVVGSSLEVHPAAGLPLETLAAGGKVAIVNRGSTQLDARTDVCIPARPPETLKALRELLE
jgi:NAD-dependent deacetylase